MSTVLYSTVHSYVTCIKVLPVTRVAAVRRDSVSHVLCARVRSQCGGRVGAHVCALLVRIIVHTESEINLKCSVLNYLLVVLLPVLHTSHYMYRQTESQRVQLTAQSAEDIGT